MSSHREAPEIAKDPVADSTDLYAFVSPDKPDTVTLIANYVPLEGPAGGPNFYEFGDDVLYDILIDNDGDGKAEIVYAFEFENEVRNHETFLYNTGPIMTLTARTGIDASSTRSPASRCAPDARPSWVDTSAPAEQHRSTLDAQLLGPGERRHP